MKMQQRIHKNKQVVRVPKEFKKAASDWCGGGGDHDKKHHRQHDPRVSSLDREEGACDIGIGRTDGVESTPLVERFRQRFAKNPTVSHIAQIPEVTQAVHRRPENDTVRDLKTVCIKFSSRASFYDRQTVLWALMSASKNGRKNFGKKVRK